MAVIYSKSDKGQREIDQRGQGLSAALRRLLIMVDGKTSAQELSARMMQDVSEGLQQLLDEGYIQGGAAGGDVTALKRELIKTAQALLGKHAERVVQKLESAPDELAGLKAAVEDCQKFVRLFIDEQQAGALFQQCQAIFRKYA